MAHRAKKIEKGRYSYRGYILNCNGYWQPDHRIAWEAYKMDEDDEIETVVAKGFAKKKIMKDIDDFLDKDHIEV